MEKNSEARPIAALSTEAPGGRIRHLPGRIQFSGGLCLRRSDDSATPPSVWPAMDDLLPTKWLTHNGLCLSVSRRLAILNSTELDLSRDEFDLLAAVMESGEVVCSKADLALRLRHETYATNFYLSSADKRVIEAIIGSVRRKLTDGSTDPRWVETVHGVGYRLAAERSGS